MTTRGQGGSRHGADEPTATVDLADFRRANGGSDPGPGRHVRVGVRLTAAAAAPTQTTATEIDTAKNAELGTYLTAGNTVYILKPSKTACTAKCLKAWPPVLLPAGVTAATAGTGVDSSKLGTVSTPSGLQITYGGKALYWFVKDKAPGQVKGNIKDKWGSGSRCPQ